MEKNIVYVDENDNVIGAGSRPDAAQKGILHRIARIFVFNSKGELLLQKRSREVKSFPNRWDDSVAGHVDEGEDYLEAAKREMKEEIGVEHVPLKEVGKFYGEVTEEAPLKKRFNMLYVAHYDGPINFDPKEISEVKWISLPELERWVLEKPTDFAQPFRDSLMFYNQSYNERA